MILKLRKIEFIYIPVNVSNWIRLTFQKDSLEGIWLLLCE